jgi:hypothetical protein
MVWLGRSTNNPAKLTVFIYYLFYPLNVAGITISSGFLLDIKLLCYTAEHSFYKRITIC